MADLLAERHRYWIVAFEFDPFPGGQATYAREISLALCRAGQDVVVISPAYGASTASAPATPFELRAVLQHQKLSLRNLWRLARELLSANGKDVILTCDIRAGLLVSLMPFLVGKRRVAMFHGGEILHASHGMFPLLLNRLSVLGAKKLVANSSFTAGLVRDLLKRSCEAIPLGVASHWHEEEGGAFESNLLASKITPTDTVVCLVARVERRKGHVVAIEAMKKKGLHLRPGFKFVFAGRAIDDDYCDEVRSLCNQWPESFIYAGEISRRDVRLLYRRSRALVLAAQPDRSRIEGFGLVITEAAAQGCPSVATRVGGIADAIQDGQTGFLCNYDDIDSLGNFIVKLVEDDVLHDRLSRSGRVFARSLTWDEVAQATFRQV